MRRALRVVVWGAIVLVPRLASGQEATACSSEQQRQSSFKLPSGQFNNFLGGGIVVRCPSKQITLRADSAEIYGDEQRIYLVGHVNYDEPRFALTSNFLTYFLTDERVVAVGDVVGRLPTGSTLRGPQAEYRRLVPRIRTRAQLLATSRPTVTIVQRDSSGKEQPPITVLANTIFMDGDSLIYGGGQVEIQRPEVNATGDSAFINSGTETMRLMRNPVVHGTRGRPFQLVGDLIDVYSRERRLQRVIARARAVATSQDMTLRSDTIDLRFREDTLERAYAWGASRARVISPAQNLVADSLDVRMPGQRVREVHALRQALAEGRPDSTRFHADTTDWLRGDTVLAYFDSVPHGSTAAPRDTSPESPRIRRLLARGHASAFYHLAATDTSVHRPAINYVKGERITIEFDERKVATVTVVGQVVGVYAEPNADTTKATTASAKPGAPGRPGAVERRPPTGGVRKP
ncbi:MAG TPA: hypothetical protein VJU87_11575 [Gemmatimonadaceae bacterium]|nr:hypothetical protein [Gemmatimonadaceae bacterium]